LTYIVLNTSRMEVDWFVAIQRLDSAVNVDHFRVRADTTSANILRALGPRHAYNLHHSNKEAGYRFST
jgi:hypothetical protein